MYLFFDTETNGLPKNMHASPLELDNWPRVIQLAYIVLDDNLDEVKTFEALIQPDGWTIPQLKFWIDNGFSDEKNAAEGIPMEDALAHFCDDVSVCNTIVAHNLNFDKPIITAEMLRYGVSPLHKQLYKHCTMLSSVSYCAIPAKNGRGYKWPKLEELHEKLFGDKFDNAHDALADVRATVRCFKELVSMGIMKV
jgi:DNA polymerase III subunit epsilon